MSMDMNEHLYLSMDKIRNTRVFDNTDVQIGKIDDLLIDRDNNRIACAVLSFGHHRQHEDDYVLDVKKSVLEKEEGFDRNEPLTQTKLLKAYTQYKLKPYWEK
jgi:hypothetical protein